MKLANVVLVSKEKYALIFELLESIIVNGPYVQYMGEDGEEEICFYCREKQEGATHKHYPWCLYKRIDKFLGA